MAFTGAMKFFEQNFSLRKDGASIVSSSSGAVSAPFMLDLNQFTKWISEGSDDTTVETLVIDLPSTKTVDRILLRDHNLKEFTIKRFDGSTFVDFTTVVGIDGALGGGISETAFVDNTAYYEFDSVSFSRIEITATKTQTVDAEKEINLLIATEEIGTFTGFPVVRRLINDRNIKIRTGLTRRVFVQKTLEARSIRMMFDRYPFPEDIDILNILHDRDDPFLVWPCGGTRGSDFFDTTLRGWRLEDIVNMEMVSPLDVSYDRNITKLGVRIPIDFQESV